MRLRLPERSKGEPPGQKAVDLFIAQKGKQGLVIVQGKPAENQAVCMQCRGIFLHGNCSFTIKQRALGPPSVVYAGACWLIYAGHTSSTGPIIFRWP